VYDPVEITIPTKLGSSGLDSLDFLSRLTARTIFSYLAKCLERFSLPVGLGCINPPATSVSLKIRTKFLIT
jgi:hypothetical protein